MTYNCNLVGEIITRIVTENVFTSSSKVRPKALLYEISIIFLKRSCFFISLRLWKDDIGPKFPLRQENGNEESYFDLEFSDRIVIVGWTTKGQKCCSPNWSQTDDNDMSRQSVDSCIEGFPWSLSWGHIPIFSHILSESNPRTLSRGTSSMRMLADALSKSSFSQSYIFVLLSSLVHLAGPLHILSRAEKSDFWKSI